MVIYDTINRAIKLQETGELESAAMLCEKILSEEPNNVIALNLLGIVRHKCGSYNEAVALIRRAVTLRPMVSQFHANLAETYRALRQLDRAAGCCRIALMLDAENFGAMNNLALVLIEQRQLNEAKDLICAALRFKSDSFSLHNTLGMVFGEQNLWEAALQEYDAALAIEPQFLDAMHNSGLALLQLRRLEESAKRFRAALHIKPNFASAHNNLGIVLREQNQLEAAIEEFNAAVASDPEFAPAQCNLGQALVDHKQADEGLYHCQEAVRLNPELAELHLGLGNAFRAVGRDEEARTAYLEALWLNPKWALAHKMLGLVLQDQRELGSALTWMRQAVDLEPALVANWRQLAELLEEREEFAEAEIAWNRALSLKPDMPGLKISLGEAMEAQGRLKEAAQYYHDSLNNPADQAIAYLKLGEVAEILGDFSAAEAAFRASLRIDPKFAMPYAYLATLLRGKLSAEDLTELERRITDPNLNNLPRADLLFGLAAVLDARGDFARAAECLQIANGLRLEENHRRRIVYDPALYVRFIDQIIREFGQGFFAKVLNAGSMTRVPIFVVGLPRSGTTLVEQVLSSHSRIFGAGELQLVQKTFDSIPSALGISGTAFDCIEQLNPNALRLIADRHETQLRAIEGGGAAYIVDKMPDNYAHLGLLAAMFPQAVFIHCRRDLRDVAVSCWLTGFRKITWANDFNHIASRFVQYCRLMDHWSTILPVSLHEINYEDVVDNLEAVARRLIEICGLEWEPQCLDFHRTNRPIRTASVTQVRQEIYRGSVGRWKNYKNELAELFALLPR